MSARMGGDLLDILVRHRALRAGGWSSLLSQLIGCETDNLWIS